MEVLHDQIKILNSVFLVLRTTQPTFLIGNELEFYKLDGDVFQCEVQTRNGSNEAPFGCSARGGRAKRRSSNCSVKMRRVLFQVIRCGDQDAFTGTI